MKNQKNKRVGKTKVVPKIEGQISISSKGIGYVKADGYEEDIEIDFKHLHTALHGDKVEVIPHAKGHGRITGEVSQIIARAKTGFTGVLEEEAGIVFLKPDDTKMYTDILIPKESLNGGKVGEKVFVKITSWKHASKAPIGEVVKVLGRPGDNNAEMHAIAIEKGFDAELPSPVEMEAKKIKQAGITEKDYAGRRDFRKILTFTIDPSDAKDFDDALSFRVLHSPLEGWPKDGVEKRPPPSDKSEYSSRGEYYEIGIHIADVSYYVKPGSPLDLEARERGTSVYLVDRTIPMLPETLSNDLCSLVPDQDRLTMSAVFVIDKNAEVKSEWYGRTVIHSQKRLTYGEAEDAIKKATLPLHPELAILNNLAKKFTEKRFREGAISLDQDEVKFVLDQNGVPIKVIKKERGDSNRLIEEFMLLANRKIAEVISKGTKKEGVFVYRIHDKPTREKMEDLAFFLRGLGKKVSLADGLIPTREINKILADLAPARNASHSDAGGGKNILRDTIHRAVVRSMAKAIYSTKNIGHYGLAFKYYTHFTSPIRRYPDILVHRFLIDYLSHKKIGKEKLKEYEEISRIASEQEKRASDAERASIKYKQVEYMSKHVGEKFDGAISGVTEWGIYVEELETKCEGLVKVRDMADDFYTFNEKKLELLGQKKKKAYRLGDRVKIKVKAVDLERKTIDYILV